MCRQKAEKMCIRDRIDEYEEEETHTGKADELIEALDALEAVSYTHLIL